MAGADDARVKISGDEKPLLESLTRSLEGLRNWGSGAQAAAGKAEGSMKSLHSVAEGLAAPIKGLTGLFAGLMAVVGGAAFSAGIEESKRLTAEAMKLAGALGIASDEASTLNTALGDIGTDSDTYVGAFNHFAKALKANEEEFKAMGLATRDAKGQLRDANTLFTEALQEVREYKVGLDQTTAAMTFFGKGVEDVRKLMKLSEAGIEEARKKNEELGLTITENNVKATKAFKGAMNDLGDVMSALWKVVGDAVMPTLTRLGNWLASLGPTAVNALRLVMVGLVGTFEALRMSVEHGFNALMTFGKTLDEIVGYATIVRGALSSGDLSGLGDAWTRTSDKIGGHWRKMWLGLKADAEDTDERLKRIALGDTSPGATVKSGNKRMGSFKADGEDKSRMHEFEELLALVKLHQLKVNVANEQFQEFSKSREAAFWQDILQTHKMSAEDRQRVNKKYVEAASDAQKKEFEGKIASLRAQEAEYANNYRVRLEFVEREAELVRKAYGDESKEAQDARRRVVETERQHQQQMLQLKLDAMKQYEQQRTGALDIEQANYKANADLMGQNVEQMLAKETEFEQRRAEAKSQYARAALDLVDPEKDPVRYEQIKAQLLEIEQAFQSKRAELVLQAQAKLQQPMRNVWDSVESNASNALKGILTHTQSWGQAMRSAIGSVGDMMIEELVTKPLAAMVIKWAKERAYAIMGVTAKAAEAGAGAAASAAETPFVGWAMALPAMASVFAGVSGLASSIPSAAGGFDIPAGVNPLTQLHEREMVLPADIADQFRSGGSGRSLGDTHISINAVDAQSVERLLMSNNAAVGKALAAAYRNGVR